EEAKDSLRKLTIQIQGEFTALANEQMSKQFIAKRVGRAIYPVLAVAPWAIAAFIFFYTNVSATDIRVPVTLIVLHLWSRLFVHLDEKTTEGVWNDIIDNWYGTRQRPRLISILRQHLS